MRESTGAEVRRSTFTNSLFDGVLAPAWSLVPIGSVLTSTQYGLSEPGDTQGDTPIVGMRDLNGGIVNLSNLATVESDGQDWTGMRLRRGDILLNRTNSPDLVGKVAIVREDTDAVFASYLVRLNVDRSKADPEFVSYWLNSFIAQRALKRISTRGVSQANINPTEFQKYCPFPLGGLPEQRKIAAILRTWDKAIERLTALRKAKAARLDALRASLLFGTKRMGAARSNWPMRRLGEVTRELTQRNAKQAFDRSAVMGVSNARGIVPMREQTVAGDISRYLLLPPLGFAYNPMRINVGSIAMNKAKETFLVSPDYVVFACRPDGLEPDYLDHLRQTRWWLHHINAGGSGSVRQRTYYDDLAALQLRLPGIDEQRSIVAVLNAAKLDVDLTDREIAALTRQKRGLMQKLLTGEWSVNLEGAAA